MFTPRTRLSRSKLHGPLHVESLEDRYVLSAVGSLPTVNELDSAPPLSVLLRTVDEIVPAIQVSIATTPSAIEAAPLQQVSALLPELFKDVEAAPIINPLSSSEVPLISLPTLTATLDVVGIPVGSQTPGISISIPVVVSGLSSGISVGTSDPITVAAGMSPASPIVQVSLPGSSTAHDGGGGGKTITIAIGAGVATVPSVVPPSEAAGVAAVVPLAPHDNANALVAAAGNDLGNLQNAVAVAGPNDIHVAGINPPTGAFVPDVPDSDDDSERAILAPLSSGLSNNTIPIDLTATENALQQFLDQLAELRQEVGGWLGNIGPTSWVLMTLTVAAVTGELTRRRLRLAQRQPFVSATAKRDALRWFPAFGNMKEES
jgi:hypothetical protein